MSSAPKVHVPKRWLTQTHLLLSFLLLVPGAASAQETAGRALSSPSEAAVQSGPASPSLMPDGWSLDLAAVTSVPLSVGLEAQLQTPIGVFFNVSGGHTPAAYLDLVRGILHDAGVFGDDVDPIVQDSIGSGGWNFRVGLGVNPVEGLELSFGYTYLTASNAITRASLEAATGQRIRYRGMDEVPISIDAHALHGRIGYRVVIADHLVLRAALGWTHSVAASTRVDVPEAVRELDADPAGQIEEAITEGFGEYGFTPEILISAGYRF